MLGRCPCCYSIRCTKQTPTPNQPPRLTALSSSATMKAVPLLTVLFIHKRGFGVDQRGLSDQLGSSQVTVGLPAAPKPSSQMARHSSPNSAPAQASGIKWPLNMVGGAVSHSVETAVTLRPTANGWRATQRSSSSHQQRSTHLYSFWLFNEEDTTV